MSVFIITSPLIKYYSSWYDHTRFYTGIERHLLKFVLILTFQYVISILHLYDSLYNRPLSNFSQKSVLAVYSKTEAAYYYLYSCIEYSRKLTVLENTVFPKPHVFSVGFLHPSCVDFFKRRKRGFCQSGGDISPPATYKTAKGKLLF